MNRMLNPIRPGMDHDFKLFEAHAELGGKLVISTAATKLMLQDDYKWISSWCDHFKSFPDQVRSVSFRKRLGVFWPDWQIQAERGPSPGLCHQSIPEPIRGANCRDILNDSIPSLPQILSNLNVNFPIKPPTICP